LVHIFVDVFTPQLVHTFVDEWRVHFNVDTLFVGLFATIVWTDHTHLCGNITNFYGAYYLPWAYLNPPPPK